MWKQRKQGAWERGWHHILVWVAHTAHVYITVIPGSKSYWFISCCCVIIQCIVSKLQLKVIPVVCSMLCIMITCDYHILWAVIIFTHCVNYHSMQSFGASDTVHFIGLRNKNTVSVNSWLFIKLHSTAHSSEHTVAKNDSLTRIKSSLSISNK